MKKAKVVKTSLVKSAVPSKTPMEVREDRAPSKKNNGMHVYEGKEVFLVRNATEFDTGFNPNGKKQVVIKFHDGSSQVVEEKELKLA
ncbi:MAG: hypothetical protein WD512_01120 [Candidatus Paceibacterota bacterium]